MSKTRDMESRTTVHTYTADQVQAAEQPLLGAGEPLMDRAASALAEIVVELLLETQQNSTARVLVLVGSGNNGGDALFAASKLGEDVPGCSVDLLTVADRWHEAGLQAALASGARLISETEAMETPYDLIIDGILGIGTSGNPNLRGAARRVVESLLPQTRTGRATAVAVDLPSGLHPDTGVADDVVLPATVTVTFGAVKAGLATGRGPELAGRLVLVLIGIEPQLETLTPVGVTEVARVIDRRARP